MSLPKHSDQFDDAELTSLAMEILQDLTDNAAVDPNDSFICELATEIEKEIRAEMDQSAITTTAPIYSSTFTDPSLYLVSPPTDSSTSVTYHHSSIPFYGPPIPKIVSRRNMSRSDSFNHSLPSIPSSPKFKPVRSHQKRAFTAYTQPKQNVFHSQDHSSPFWRPPSINQATDIYTCLSPRRRTPKQKTCQVPVFTEVNEVHVTQQAANQIVSSKLTQTKIIRKPKHVQQNDMSSNMMSPIFIPSNNGYIQKHKSGKKRVATHTSNHSTTLPHSGHWNDSKRNNRYRPRISRKRSNSLKGNEMIINTKEEADDSLRYMYISTRNGVLKVAHTSNNINCLISRAQL
eukprot:59336_1